MLLTTLLETVLNAAQNKKGEDLVAIEVGSRTSLADTFVIVSGRSRIQTRAIVDEIVDEGKAWGQAPLRVEGYNEASWILVDFGTIVVHIFTPEQRAFYNIERLWGSKGEIPAPNTAST